MQGEPILLLHRLLLRSHCEKETLLLKKLDDRARKPEQPSLVHGRQEMADKEIFVMSTC